MIGALAVTAVGLMASAQAEDRRLSFLGRTSQSSYDKCDDDYRGWSGDDRSRSGYKPRCVSKVRCDNGWGNGADCTNPGSPKGNDRERESKTTQSGTNGNGNTQTER
ncbi:hypothetical protein [Alsobacter sp. R-9]